MVGSDVDGREDAGRAVVLGAVRTENEFRNEVASAIAPESDLTGRAVIAM